MVNGNPSIFDKPPSYRSYLLRFWEERSEQPMSTVWRFSLEDPRTAQRQSFANLEALVAWLQAEISRPQSTGRPVSGDIEETPDSL
jgi:hypothetical protein